MPTTPTGTAAAGGTPTTAPVLEAGSSVLTSTGSNPLALGIGGAVLVGLGAGFLLVTRRRQRT